MHFVRSCHFEHGVDSCADFISIAHTRIIGGGRDGNPSRRDAAACGARRVDTCPVYPTRLFADKKYTLAFLLWHLA